MPRGIGSDIKTDIEDGKYQCCMAVAIVGINGGNLLLSNGIKEYPSSLDPYVYTPAGSLLSISSTNENSDLGTSGITIQLSGCDNTLVTIARDTEFQGASVIVWIFQLDENLDRVEPSIRYFTGILDNMVYRQSGNEIIIEVSCENFLVRLDDRNIRRYTHEDQKDAVGSGDSGLTFVEDIAEQKLVWGA
ncbi:hypothetical protein N8909_01300 [bacterium]|nr:hypothetical protein [bacterium]